MLTFLAVFSVLYYVITRVLLVNAEKRQSKKTCFIQEAQTFEVFLRLAFCICVKLGVPWEFWFVYTSRQSRAINVVMQSQVG